jgi:hypothetical protein
MVPDSQPGKSEALHDDFQTAAISFTPAIGVLWLAGRRSSLIRMLSLERVMESVTVEWGARAGHELGAFAPGAAPEPQARSPSGMDLRGLCMSLMQMEASSFPRYLREGAVQDDNGTILGRLRDETSELHILLYLKMFEHMAVESMDERVWRPAMMLMSDITTIGDEPMRQEIASLCLERVMLVCGQKCGAVAPMAEASAYSDLSPALLASPDVPLVEGRACVQAERKPGSERAYREKFDFARACLSESMMAAHPRIQTFNLNALAISHGVDAIGPMLALCIAMRMRPESERAQLRSGQEAVHGLIMHHLAQAHPIVGGDSHTLPEVAEHLFRTSMLMLDPTRTLPGFSQRRGMGRKPVEIAHESLARLLDPKGVLHPHPSYAFDPVAGTLTPRFPHGGLQQSSIVAVTELALNGCLPAASTVLRAMLELAGSHMPLSLLDDKPPRQIRETLGLLAECVSSLEYAGIPGARSIPPVFIRGEVRPGELLAEQLAELAVPALEMVRINAAILGAPENSVPLMLAASIVQADVDARSKGAEMQAPDAFRELMRRRNDAFGGSWSSFELPDTSALGPLLRRLDERAERRGVTMPAPPPGLTGIRHRNRLD